MLVAFSGGVDSSLLLALAAKTLGNRCLAVTANSISYAEHERLDAQKLATRLGVRHLYVDMDQMGVPGFVENGPDRCYYCKKALFMKLKELAAREGLAAAPAMHEEQVAELHAQVQEGTFSVDAQALAQKLLSRRPGA